MEDDQTRTEYASPAWLELLLTPRGLRRIRRNYGVLGLAVLGLGVMSDLSQVFGPFTAIATFSSAVLVISLIVAAHWRPQWRETIALPLAAFTAFFIVGALMMFGQTAFAARDRGLIGTASPTVAQWQDEMRDRLTRIEGELEGVNARLDDIAERIDICPDGMDANVCALLRLSESGQLSEAGAAALEGLLLANLTTGDAPQPVIAQAVAATVRSQAPADRAATRLIAAGEIDAALDTLQTAAGAETGDAADRWLQIADLAYDVRVDASIDAFEHALALRPEDGETRLRLAAQYSRVGDLQAAEAMARSVLETSGAAPATASRARVEIGLALMRRGRLDAAEAAFTQARADALDLSAEDSSDAALRSLARAYSALGHLYFRRGEDAEALAAYRDAAALHQRRTADPNAVDARLDHAGALHDVGRAQAELGDYAAALIAIQASLDRLRADPAADSDPGIRRGVALSLGSLSGVRAIEGDLDAALAAGAEAVEIHRGLAAEDASNAEAQRDLARALIRLSDIRADSGQPDAALTLLEEAAATLQRLDADAIDLEPRRALAGALERLGMARAARGDPDGAERSEREALEIALGIEAEAADMRSRRDALIILERLGDRRLAADDEAGALDYYRRALERHETNLADAPMLEDIQMQYRLLYHMAGIAGGQGETQQQVAWLRDAQDVMRAGAALYPEGEDWAGGIALLEESVAEAEAGRPAGDDDATDKTD